MNHAHDEVVVEEAPREPAVGADPADNSGEVDDDVGTHVSEHLDDRRLLAQIVMAAPRSEDVRRTPLFGRLDDVASKKAVSPSHNHTLTVEIHLLPPLATA